MNALKDMILTKVNGEYYAVPLRSAKLSFSGMIRMNKTGKRIFELLRDGLDEAAAAAQLQQEFRVDEDTARENVHTLAQKLRDEGLL